MGSSLELVTEFSFCLSGIVAGNHKPVVVLLPLLLQFLFFQAYGSGEVAC